VSWLLRVGFLLSPPVVGKLADVSSLRVGLLLVPLTGITVIALSRSLTSLRKVTADVGQPASEFR
jgi:hypothetical protein